MSKHPIILSAVAGLAAWAATTCLPLQQAAAEDPTQLKIAGVLSAGKETP
jgi:hypothetical protein